MGSRGSDFNDDSVKKNKSKKPPLSNAEIRIETEGTKFKDLPKIGLSQSKSLYVHHSKLAIDIMNKVKQDAMVVAKVPSLTNRTSDIFIDKLIEGRVQGVDGGYYVSENNAKTSDFVTTILGYNAIADISDDIANALSSAMTYDVLHSDNPQHIFNMKYSDRYIANIGGKKQEGQLYEYKVSLKDKSGKDHDAYVKLMNIHAKNGATYSIVMSIHEPEREISQIWNRHEEAQPRYNK